MEGLGVCCQLESSKNLKVIISEHKNVNTVHSAVHHKQHICLAMHGFGGEVLRWSVVFSFLSLSLFAFNCIPLLEGPEMLPGPAAGSREGSGGFGLQGS